MLHLVLADSELETVPRDISSEKVISREAEKRGKSATELLLDSNYHYKAMERLEDHERRGRPDIVQICMLTALDTPLNREGGLNLYVHTRHDKVVEVDSETRIPRSYNRFIGLMEQLFEIGRVPPEGSLMVLNSLTLREKWEEIDPDRTITLSHEGEPVGRNDIFQGLDPEDDVCVIVGGFSHGGYLSEVESISDHLISIYPEVLDAVTVVTHMVQFYEEYSNLI